MSPSRVSWRLDRAARILIPLLIVCLLPLLILEDATPTLRVGIVNTDEGATVSLPSGESQYVPFGRQLSAALLDTQARSGADIELLAVETALQGFEEGALDALILIPADFSQHLAAFGTPQARQAYVEVHIRTSLAQNSHALATYIDESARHSLARTLNENLLHGIYGGLDTMKDGMQQASEGSAELASGTAQAARGIDQLHAGSSQLADGLERFSAGVDALHQGAQALAGGSAELSNGLGQLAEGAQHLSSGINELAAGLTGTSTQPGLMPGVNALADGVLGTENAPGLVQGTRQLADGNRQLADSIDTMLSTLDPLRKLFPPPEGGAGIRIDLVTGIAHTRALAQAALETLNASTGIVDTPEAIAGLKERLRQLVEQCPSNEPEFCRQLSTLVDLLSPYLDTLPAALQQSRQVLEAFLAQTGTPEFNESIQRAQQLLDDNGGLQGLLYGPQGALAQLDALRSGTRQLADGAELLADRVGGTKDSPGLAQGVTQLRDGVEQLHQGVTGRNRYGDSVSDTHLVGGAGQLADGLWQASQGAVTFDSGMQRYRDGVGEANAGARSLSDGAQRLRGGSAAAADGLGRLSDGAQQLASGLSEGVQKIPSYSSTERAQIVKVALSPILPTGTHTAEAPSLWADEAIHGTQLSTLVIIMWVVGAIILLRTAPFSSPQLSRPITAAHVALNSLRGPLTVGGALAVVSLLVLWGISPSQDQSAVDSSMVWTACGEILTVFIGVSAIVVIHQGLMAVSGSRNGPGVVMVALTVQLIPMVTSALFHGNATEKSWVEWTPLGAFVRSLQAVYFHDGMAQWLGALVVLLLWALAGFIVSVLSVSRYRSESENAALLEALRHRAS